MRLLTKTVPLSPSRSERAFGTPLMNTSILNPLGSLSCGVGNLSAAMGKGGGLMPRSLVAASEVGWLGVGGGRGRRLLGGRRESCERARERCREQERPLRREADGHAILPDRAFTCRECPTGRTPSAIGIRAQGSTPDERPACGGRRRERRCAVPRVLRRGHGREQDGTPDRWRRRRR